MSTTITLSMETLLLGVPSLVAFSGAVTFVALRGYLTDAVEGHRLLAAADERSARWLFLRGYRRTPHAGPDVTPEPEPLAIAATAFDPGGVADTDRRGIWLVLLGLARDLLDRAVSVVTDARQQWAERNLVGSGEQAQVVGRTDEDIAAEIAVLTGEPASVDDSGQWARDAAITDGPDTAEPVNREPYRGKHWISDVQHTNAWPLVVPKQRNGEGDR